MCIFFIIRFLIHHDSGDANAHVADDVEFVVEEILDAAFTILQIKNIWWGFGWLVSTAMGSGRSLIFLERMSDLTWLSGAGSGQGLPIVPQQFNWHQAKICFGLLWPVWFIYLFPVVSVVRCRVRQGDSSTYYFLVCGDQRAVIALVVFCHVEVLNILYDLCKKITLCMCLNTHDNDM